MEYQIFGIATLRNGRECHTKCMQVVKVKTTLQTTSTHVPTLSTICRFLRIIFTFPWKFQCILFLSDILLTQIQKDIYSSYSLPWTRRSMWNRNYSETRLPATPSTIIELLSHQNFADMQLGHDPNLSLQWGVPFTKVFCSSLPTSTIKNTLFSLCLWAISPFNSERKRIY